jgi:membrane-associated protein
MEFLALVFDFLLHFDKYLVAFVENHGAWVYALLFLIIFAETGLVVTPILPGDSLLFVAGTLAAVGSMDLWWLMATLIIAAILGDTVNYWIGDYLGHKLFSADSRWLNRSHLERAHEFYERHGGKTIVIGRFIPILRTFAPFVAGMGEMPYRRFLFYNVGGAILWVVSLVGLGFYFGELPFVKQNLTLIIVLIVIVSVLPGVVEYLRHRHRSKNP